MSKDKNKDVLSKSVAWATLISAGSTVISTIIAAISLELMLSNGQQKDNGINKSILLWFIISLIASIVCAVFFGRSLYKIFKRLKKFLMTIEEQQSGGICPWKYTSFQSVTGRVTSMLGDFLSENVDRIEKVCIICYGRKGFDEIVQRNIDEWKIKMEIIVYDPGCDDICKHELDKTKVEKNLDERIIHENIKSWLKSDVVSVIVTKIPPMMRAVLVYKKPSNTQTEDEKTMPGKENAIWGSMQSYRFALNGSCTEHRIFLEKPKNSLICVCEESKTPKLDFGIFVECFEEEFKRLSAKENSREAKLIDDDFHFITNT